MSNYDVVANLYGGRVQIVNEFVDPILGNPTTADFTAVYNRETTFFTGINGGIYGFLLRDLPMNVVIKNFDIVENLDPLNERALKPSSFIRAICHGAVKMYARPYGYTADNSHPGVPLRIAARCPCERRAVYAQVVEDRFAADNLPVENGVYATQDAARAYLRSFLMGNYRKPQTSRAMSSTQDATP